MPVYRFYLPKYLLTHNDFKNSVAVVAEKKSHKPRDKFPEIDSTRQDEVARFTASSDTSTDFPDVFFRR